MDRGLVRVAAVGASAALLLVACGGAAPENAGTTLPTPTGGRLTVGTVLAAGAADSAEMAAMQTAARIAVKEINKAGGVGGKRVRLVSTESEDPAAATQELVDRDSDVLVGAGGPDATTAVLDRAVTAKVMLVSPSDGTDALTALDNRGLFWRTAAPDRFQAAVLADTLAGKQPAVVVAPGSAALAESFRATVESLGNRLAREPIAFDPATGDTTAVVRQVKRSKPDAVVLMGQDTTALLPALADLGLPISLLDVALTTELADILPSEVGDRTVGLLPGAEVPQPLRDRLAGADPDAVAYPFAAQAYDAVVVSALAALAAASDRPAAIAAKMIDVTTGGTACDEFAECERLLGEGKDIDYDGPSGPLDFQASGDPGQAVMGLYRVDEGQWAPDQYVEGTVPPPLG